MKQYKIQNYCSFVFTTNNNCPLEIPTDDRRFSMMELDDCLNILTEDGSKYWDFFEQNVISELGYKNWIALSVFYDFFMNIDITNFDFIRERPITAIYKNAISMPEVEQFIHDFIRNPYSIFDDVEEVYNVQWKDVEEFKADVLFRQYLSWRAKANQKGLGLSKTGFGRFFKFDKFVYGGVMKIKDVQNYVLYKFDVEKINNYMLKYS